MGVPDVRWEGVSHKQIVEWTGRGSPGSVTERLERRLTSAVAALVGTASLANSVLQRVNGEWTGNAATAAANAMKVLRDHDDAMGGHCAKSRTFAAEQSENALWARANVPPLVDVPADRLPTGNPFDIVMSTVDQHRMRQQAKDAEEQARQVMRQYQETTAGRLAALPPLPPPPRVVLGGHEDTIFVEPGKGDRVPPPDVRPDAADTDGSAPTPRPDGPVRGEPPTGGESPGGESARTSAADGSAVGDSSSGDASVTAPSLATDARSPVLSSPVIGEAARPGAAPAGGVVDGAPQLEPLRGQPALRGQPGESRPGARGAVAGRGSSAGVVPFGTAAPAKSEEDREHQVRYGIPESKIFEPEDDDGMLYDPFRPGSFVSPPAIGVDDDE